MGRPIIYLASVAGSCREMLKALASANATELIDRVQSVLGDEYLVEGDTQLIESALDDDRGGRADDAERAAAIENRLADRDTAALVALRGGAWLTRILDRIDFDVLERRRRRIALFGFSELTTLLNIASAYPQAFCLYDLGPGFIRTGLSEHPTPVRDRLTGAALDERFRAEFLAFFRDVRAVLEGKGSGRSITGTLAQGALSAPTEARFAGGNLTVLSTLLGTPYAQAADPQGRWLAIEDVNESPERIDRRLAHLKLAGLFERSAGLLVGDFHEGDTDHQEAVIQLLRYHLPSDRNVPVITTRDVGHVWPLAPLPLNSPVVLEPTQVRGGQPSVTFKVCWPTIVAPHAADR